MAVTDIKFNFRASFLNKAAAESLTHSIITKRGRSLLLLSFSLLQGLILHQLQRYSLSEKVLRDAVQVNR